METYEIIGGVVAFVIALSGGWWIMRLAIKFNEAPLTEFEKKMYKEVLGQLKEEMSDGDREAKIARAKKEREYQKQEREVGLNEDGTLSEEPEPKEDTELQDILNSRKG